MTIDLDTRLDMAAGSLHRAVADLPLEAPPRPSGRSPVVLGVVLLTVAGVTAAVVGAATRDDKGVNVNARTVADVQGLIANPVPEGFQVGWAGDQSAAANAATGAAGATGKAAVGANSDGNGLAEGQAMGLDTYLYGDTDGATSSPFTTSDLVVNVWDASGLSAGAAGQATAALDGLAGATTATVQGHAAKLCAPPGCQVKGDADVTTVWWHETDDVELVVASRSLTAQQVVAVADGLTVHGDAVSLGTLPGGLPGPLDQVGHLKDAAAAASGDAVAHWVGYTDPSDATGRFVDVTTLTGNRAELMALVWELGADQQVEVRGKDGWLAVADSGVAGSAGAQAEVPQLDLVWQEASGVLVHVTSLGVAKNDVLELVESLHSASDDEWQQVTETAAAANATATDDGGQATASAGAAGAQADAGAGVDTSTGQAGAGVSAATGDGTSVGAGVTAGADGQVDAGAAADTGVAQIDARLHADLGTDAVIGAVQDGLTKTVDAASQATTKLEDGGKSTPGAGQLVP
jgi:hypothetical protein